MSEGKDTMVVVTAITKSDNLPVKIPLWLFERIDEQFRIYPDGVPMVMENGKTYDVLAFMMASKNMHKHKPVLMFTEGGEVD